MWLRTDVCLFVLRILVLSMDWMQDKMPATAKPSVRYNDTGRDGQSKLPTHLIVPERCIGTQTQLLPSRFIYPSKGGRVFPCFQPALLINRWGENKKGKSCQPDQGLKRKSPNTTGIFPGPLCRSADKGSHPVSTELSHFKRLQAARCIPLSTLATRV